MSLSLVVCVIFLEFSPSLAYKNQAAIIRKNEVQRAAQDKFAARIKVHTEKLYPVYVPKPYPVAVKKHVPYLVKVPVPKPFKVEKKIPYAVKIPVEHFVPFRVEKPYPVYIEKKVPVPMIKKVPFPVKIPYERPYPVRIPVFRPIPYPVEKRIPIPVKVPVERPVPFHVVKPVPYPVEKKVPYPLQVPVEIPYEVPILKQVYEPVNIGLNNDHIKGGDFHQEQNGHHGLIPGMISNNAAIYPHKSKNNDYILSYFGPTSDRHQQQNSGVIEQESHQLNQLNLKEGSFSVPYSDHSFKESPNTDYTSNGSHGSSLSSTSYFLNPGADVSKGQEQSYETGGGISDSPLTSEEHPFGLGGLYQAPYPETLHNVEDQGNLGSHQESTSYIYRGNPSVMFVMNGQTLIHHQGDNPDHKFVNQQIINDPHKYYSGTNLNGVAWSNLYVNGKRNTSLKVRELDQVISSIGIVQNPFRPSQPDYYLNSQDGHSYNQDLLKRSSLSSCIL